MTKPIGDGLFHIGNRHANFTLAQRFEQSYEPIPECGCWIWSGAITNQNYGRISIGPRGNSKQVCAHHVAWRLYRGEIPHGLQVNHHCDVSLCVNPNHLYVGTQKQNMEDRDRRGRNAWDRGTRVRKTNGP
jgi:HNH endonuclease